MSKIKWNDLFEGTFKDLKKTYKMTDREIEVGVRKHLDGANASERSKLYETVYSYKNKR